jgi:hypothetical protein
MPTYNVKTQFPRSFTQQIFLKSGGSAILRMKGAFGVIDSEKNIPERDLNFILNLYNLNLEDAGSDNVIIPVEEVNEAVSTTKKPIKKSTKVSTTVSLPEFQFTEDL